MNINDIKLIIWDLDDTFWEGTISETNIIIDKSKIDLIKNLTERGIVNSICSKNELSQCEKILEREGILDYFVFISIDWTSKGQRVNKIIENMNLRSKNVLFIDDNIQNIKEVQFYNPDIMAELPDVIEVLKNNYTKIGKDDKELSRLKQYKNLEKKQSDSLNYDSNELFLRNINLKTIIKNDCINQSERIHELILRTNQLNFTKRKISKAELDAILTSSDYSCGYIEAEDKYGHYGIIGFYSIYENELLDFLFSCRTMGMGIEQYIYAKLGFPKISIVQPVSGDLIVDVTPDWINQNETLSDLNNESKKSINNNESSKKIIFKGPCDFSVLLSYLDNNNYLSSELNFRTIEGTQVDHFNHTINIKNSYLLSSKDKESITNNYSFLPPETFETSLFSKNYSIVFLSILMDTTLAVYKNKKNDIKIAYGLMSKPITDPANWDRYINKEIMTARSEFDIEMLQKFSDEYELINYDEINIVDNINDILSYLDKNSRLIVLLAAETPFNNDTNFKDKHIFHRKINDQIRRLSSNESRVDIIDVNKYITKQSDYFDSINHYSQRVYYELAKEVDKIIKQNIGVEIKLKNRYLWLLKDINKKIRRLIKKALIKLGILKKEKRE